ncbi:MFS transporter [Aeromicrobium sp.]|uniref:MFS transporter n=1 Tax=Aeromicrobium sp. TaxID=1871063 RepID=UPI003516F9BE
MTGLRGLGAVQEMPPRARRLVAINAINAAGSGVVLPLLVVYLYEVRDLPLSVATGTVAATSVGALVGAPVIGWLSDRVGRVPALWVALVCSAAGAVGLAFSATASAALLSGVVQGLGIGGAIVWNALIAELVPDQYWPVLFSVDFAVVNAMMGLGGLAGGLVAGLLDSLVAFQVLYVVDGLSFLLTGLLVVRELRHQPGGSPSAPPDAPDPPVDLERGAARGGYLEVLRHRWMLALLVAVLVLFTLGYSQLNSGMPAVVLEGSRLGATELGLMFAANTTAVVVVQILLLSRLKHLTPRRAFALLGACWAGFWLLVLGVLGVGGGLVAVAVGLLAMAVFALGESLLAATGPTLVNTWADDHNRGRFNAAYGFTSSLGFAVGPVLSGVLVERGHAVPMVLVFAVGLSLLAAVALRSSALPDLPLERLEQDGHHPGSTGPSSPDDPTTNEGARP